MTAAYTGDADVRFWQMGDTQIPNTGKAPVYSGYEDAILKTLGLTTKDVKINSSKWGKVGTANGQRVQDASFAVSRYGNDYAATFRTQVPRVRYTATAVYELEDAKLLTGDTIYTLRATAEYAPVQKGLSPLAVAGIVFGALVLIATVVVILFILAKKRKEKEEQQKQIN